MRVYTHALSVPMLCPRNLFILAKPLALRKDKVHCYLATRPEVEGFRDPEVESLRVQFLGFLKKALPSREEPDISLSILNSKARLPFFILAHCVRNIRRVSLLSCHFMSPVT